MYHIWSYMDRFTFAKSRQMRKTLTEFLFKEIINRDLEEVFPLSFFLRYNHINIICKGLFDESSCSCNFSADFRFCFSQNFNLPLGSLPSRERYFRELLTTRRQILLLLSNGRYFRVGRYTPGDMPTQSSLYMRLSA